MNVYTEGLDYDLNHNIINYSDNINILFKWTKNLNYEVILKHNIKY